MSLNKAREALETTIYSSLFSGVKLGLLSHDEVTKTTVLRTERAKSGECLSKCFYRYINIKRARKTGTLENLVKCLTQN